MEQATKKPSILGNYYVRIVGTLFVITTVVAVLLAGVNSLTKDPIAANAAEKKAGAIALVMPGADSFDTLEAPQGIDSVTEILLAKKGGESLGYCVQTSTNGNDGAITLMVGIGLDGKITQVSILSQKETMGVNKHGELIAQFAGMSGSAKLKADGDDGNVDAISNATITSRAVTKGVDAALAAVKVYVEGGAQ